MKSFFPVFLLIFLTQSFVFAEANYEDSRTIVQSDANYRDLLYIYYKGTNTELTDEIVTNYIKDFYETDYNNFRQNEFEWPAILNRHRTELASKIDNANLTAAYTFQTRASLGNYNFDLGGFDVNINMEYLFLTKRGLSIGDGTTYPDVASKGILIFINNINSHNFMAIERDVANAFITSRTKNGNVDRSITLHISFSISNFFPDTGIFLIAQMNNSVSARITKIDVNDGTKKLGELTSKNLIVRQNQPEISFSPDFVGTWKRDSFNNTLTLTENTLKASDQDVIWDLTSISGDIYTFIQRGSDNWFGTITIKLINNNLEISGGNGSWAGIWKQQVPLPVFYVNDSAEALSSDTIRYITERSTSLNNEKGVHIIIATVTNTENSSVDEYALQKWYEWIDEVSNSNAILFIIRIMPDRWDWRLLGGNGRIIQTVGVENILNNIRLIDSSYFNNRRYNEGIRAIYDVIHNMF